MSVVLPSTVEEINYMQSHFLYNQLVNIKDDNNKEDFSNIQAGKFKRLLSIPCPEGVQWNDIDFDAYLTFNDPNLVSLEVTQSHEDRLVPGEEQRPRSECESISSVASNMDEKSYVYNNLGVKTFNTVCVDSGSTCISSDHSYVNLSPSVFKDLEAEETFQNLRPLLSQGPELHNCETTSSISSANSHLNENFDYSVLSNISMISNSQDSNFSDRSSGFKQSAAVLDNDLFMTVNSPRRSCKSPNGRFSEMRKKNNAASKNCRKTRKEKQKEMESRVTELEKEREDLLNQINYFEVMIPQFKKHISSIIRPVHNV